MTPGDVILDGGKLTARARRRHKAALVPWLVNVIETHRKAAKVSRSKARQRVAAAVADALAEHEQIEMVEHAADSPVVGVSGRIRCSPAERSGAGDNGSTDGQSRVPRRSEAEPGNTKPQGRTRGEAVP